MSVRKPDQIKEAKFTPAMAAAEDLFQHAIIAIQKVCRVDSFEYYAMLGHALGHSLGCNDAHIEKEEKIGPDDEEAKPFYSTFLLNVEVAYNEHRSIHERRECKTKPEPKIV